MVNQGIIEGIVRSAEGTMFELEYSSRLRVWVDVGTQPCPAIGQHVMVIGHLCRVMNDLMIQAELWEDICLS